MSPLESIALAVTGAAALVAVGSFAMIANYLFDQALADRNDPFPNIIDLYRKFRDHTRAQRGRVDPRLWIHLAAVAVFIAGGMAYVAIRFV